MRPHLPSTNKANTIWEKVWELLLDHCHLLRCRLLQKLQHLILLQHKCVLYLDKATGLQAWLGEGLKSVLKAPCKRVSIAVNPTSCTRPAAGR